ncbi:MAG: hypothetical protein ACR2K6_04160 [Solirubrobacterales bacterium]
MNAPPPPSGFALYRPRVIEVRAAGGRPAVVEPRAVESTREEWLVEDRWRTRDCLRRHYFELTLEGGRRLVIFCDLAGGGWYEQ